MPKFLPYESYVKDTMPGLNLPSSNRIIVGPLVTVFINGEEIGFITDLNYDVARRGERIRHLNFADAGRIVEQVPAPSDFTLRATGFSLYTSTVLGRIAGIKTGSDQDTAEVPPDGGIIVVPEWLDRLRFDVQEIVKHPNKDNSSYAIIYGDCLVTNYTRPVSVGRIFISENVTLQPTWLSVKTSGIPQITDNEPVPITPSS